jgi:ABC-2 type transport system permease protein
MKEMIAFWNILRKDIENYYLKPPNISWGIIFPISWTLIQMIRSSGGIDVTGIREMLPGLMAMSVLFGTTSMLAVTITFERKGRSFDRLILAPISLSTMVSAKISGALVFGFFNAFVPVAFAAVFTDLSGIEWIAAIPAVFLIALTSTLLGLLIAISAREVFEAQTFSNFFRFPMLFLCGLFIPISCLPPYLRPLSFFLPLTYGTDMLRGSVTGENIMALPLSAAVMMFFAAVLFLLCHRNIHRKWIM